MAEWSYPGADNHEAAERERLGLVEQLTDPISVARLTALRVAPGWRCLEVGAGRGSVARWLAERVGPTGKVVATEVDTRFLSDTHAPAANVEVRQHDVLTTGFEEQAYDLVHCRAVLMHLRDPASALRRMADAVKPGGLLCVEEVDWTSLAASDPSHPRAPDFDRSSRIGFDAVRAAGASDSYFGRRVLELVTRLGFHEIAGEGTVLLGRGGDHPLAQHQRALLALPVTGLLVSKGILTPRTVEGLLETYSDPEFHFVGFTLFGAWGKKPQT